MLLTVLFVIVVIAAGAAGGALCGLQLGGKDLGTELASMTGAFYGLTATLPAAIAVALYFAFAAH